MLPLMDPTSKPIYQLLLTPGVARALPPEEAYSEHTDRSGAMSVQMGYAITLQHCSSSAGTYR